MGIPMWGVYAERSRCEDSSDRTDNTRTASSSRVAVTSGADIVQRYSGAGSFQETASENNTIMNVSSSTPAPITLDHFQAALNQDPAATRFIIQRDSDGNHSVVPYATSEAFIAVPESIFRSVFSYVSSQEKKENQAVWMALQNVLQEHPEYNDSNFSIQTIIGVPLRADDLRAIFGTVKDVTRRNVAVVSLNDDRMASDAADEGEDETYGYQQIGDSNINGIRGREIPDVPTGSNWSDQLVRAAATLGTSLIQTGIKKTIEAQAVIKAQLPVFPARSDQTYDRINDADHPDERILLIHPFSKEPTPGIRAWPPFAKKISL